MKSQRLNSNDGTNMCMDYLNNSIHNLERVLELIIENNKNGKQFDYCNCPELSSAVDKMAMLIKNISVSCSLVYDSYTSSGVKSSSSLPIK